MKLRNKLVVLIVLSVASCSLLLFRSSIPTDTAATSEPRSDHQLSVEEQKSIADNFAQIPLHFELNQGQADPSVRFISRSGNHALFLKQNEAQLVLPNRSESSDGEKQMEQPDVLTMKLANANDAAKIEGLDELAGRTNYFVGANPETWQKDLRPFKKVKYSSVYDGVDLIYYGNQRELEYDLIIEPHADPNVISLDFENARDIKIDSNGDLILSVGKHEIRQKAPVVFQDIDGARKPVDGRYEIRQGTQAERVVGIKIGEYDHDKPLVIDPVISFSTYLGGSAGDDLFNFEVGFGIAVDSGGNVYVAGLTPSADFPTQNPYQPSSAGSYDGFITKFNPTGTALIYSTYFGGSDEDRVISISVGPANEMFVSGFTYSTNFPTMTPFQSTLRGQNDGFIARFTSSGVLNYSTYLGGAGGDSCNFIKNIGTDIVAFAGSTGSNDFPVANALQPNSAGSTDFFAGKLNLATNTLIFSTYFGGSGTESMIFGSGAIDPAGNVYVGGVSNSFDYPTSPNAFQTENNGSDDAVVTKISANGSGVIYSTLLGGNLVDSADALAVDSSGNAYVTGFTRSANYPLKNPAQPQLNDPDAFVTKLNPTGTGLVFSTFLGGQNLERGSAIATDAAGNCYVTGRSNSGDFPAKRSLRPPRGLDDTFVSKFNRDGALLFSTLLGGGGNDYGFAITADNNNNAYITGRATRSFFTTPSVFQPTIGGQADAFVTKINTSVRKVKGDFDGDGKTDVAVFRPSQSVWYLLQSSLGFRYEVFGLNTDELAPGDYDSDGKTDIAVFRKADGIWYILNSRTNTLRTQYWGNSSDVAVQGDYDGDDKTDVAVYRSNGFWYIIQSSNNNLRTITLGSPSDKAVQADYDGDGVTDAAIYSPNLGVWTISGSFAGVIAQRFGLPTDRPVPGDYDGDGYDDIAVYRASTGTWYSVRSGNNNSFSAIQWGTSEDIPAAGDYDGDGKEDVAVFRPSNGTWYVSRSSDNSLFAVQFGLNGDKPIPTAYVPQ